MKAIELLEKYPEAAKVVNEFYRSKMMNSMETDDVPEEFKEMLKEQSFDNEYIATFIDSSPRFLFDVFDDHEVYINISAPKFSYSIDAGDVISGTWETRKEAEAAAIEHAFAILNDKL